MNQDYLSENKKEQLNKAIQAKCGNTLALVLSKDDTIIYESYRKGFKATDSHHVASVTKSILSALIGIAIDKGYIESVHQNVIELLPVSDKIATSPTWDQITLQHLLNMTCPFKFEDWKEPFDKLCSSDDWLHFILDLIGDVSDVGTFKYSSSGAHLLSIILSHSTGLSTREFANLHLFEPTGMMSIAHYEMDDYGFEDLFGSKVKGWVHDPAGHSTGGWGLSLTAKDMIQFGNLFLNSGKQSGQRIVSEEWVKQSTSHPTGPYGYLWWHFLENNITAYAAIGDGGNIICCVPSENLVIAMASSFEKDTYDRWTFIKEEILPLVSNGDL